MAETVQDQTTVGGNDSGRKAKRALHETGEAARQYADEVSHKARESVDRYPIMTVAGAAVVGLLAGALMRR